MIELFPNISDEVKESAELIFRHAMSTSNPIEAVKILNTYTNILSEEEAEFARFYFNIRLEENRKELEQLYEGNNNKREERVW